MEFVAWPFVLLHIKNKYMQLIHIAIILSAICIIGIAFLIKQVSDIRSLIGAPKDTRDNSPLQLQAYERLTLFTERNSLRNLVTRVQPQVDNAATMHAALLDEIKNEFGHNITQQVYVTPEVWNAVTRMKDQNIYIINQIAATMPGSATANDLNRKIIEYSLQENAELGQIVLDAIQFEAKKLM